MPILCSSTRRFNKLQCLSGLFTFLLLSSFLIACNSKPTSEGKEPSAPTKPNVIIILTDDQGYGDLGVHGNPWMKTPHLDAFASNAVEATNFHVGTTCTPTRAGIMTGRNANRNGSWHTIAGCSILNEDEQTMASVFNQNGYATSMFGKWHLGDNYPYRPHDRGFQEAFYCKGGGVWQSPDYWLNDYFDDTYFRNGEPEKVYGYCTDVWFDETIKYIEAHKEEPFLLYLALNAAHGPFNVPEKYMAMYEDTPLTPTQKRFYGMVTNIDENFGRLQEYLNSSGLDENTILIFTSDNGTAGGITRNGIGYNAGLKGVKGSNYDGGHRVPFFIRWPKGGLKDGRKVHDLLAHVDLLPTLTQMAGIDFNPASPLDGENVQPIIQGTAEDSVRMLVIDTQRNQWPEKGRNSCVMSTNWRLVNGNELYHFKNDPGQQNDIAEAHPDQVAKMKKFYDEWWATTEGDWKYSPLVIGNENENPTMITVHDMHSEENLPWNQVMVRKAEHNPIGFYTLNVQQEGNYDFKLMRYPLESNLALNASAAEIPAQKSVDGFPKGRKVNVTKAFVKIDEKVYTTEVDQNATYAQLAIALSAGDSQLSTWFELENGDKIPVYYNLVERN